MELQNTNGTIKKSFYKKNKKPLKRAVLAGILLLLVAGCLIGSKKVKEKGYDGLWDFTRTVVSNYRKGMDANPENLSIKIGNKDFKALEKNRAQALERGLIINDLDGDYVPAEMEYKGKKISVKLRLKGHMTDHLQDNKWSFRIKVKDKGSFMGMKRFSIQHPGTRGYIYEWIYHELMKREGIIALRYKFINVTVNGRDWGIYAVEENFEDELVENNNRKRGPVLRFNPDLYWVHRNNMRERVSSADEFASYYSANPEAYREEKVLEDSTQRGYYMKAISLIEGLRSRKLRVDQVFDVERLAKFHALIDVVGGANSIDWSDVKYYYNPVTARLEPVAYESFTDLETHDLSSFYKYVQPDSTQNYSDWHTMIFSNEKFFKAYVQQLERMTEPSYLDAFFNDSNEELNKNLAILYKEFPYKKFDARSYYKRGAMIRKVLDSPKAIHAYFKGYENGTAQIQLGAIDALPVQIHFLKIGNIKSDEFTATILPPKQPGTYVDYHEVNFRFPDNFKWNPALADSATILYSILGSAVIKEAKVFPFPHTDSEFIAKEMQRREGNADKFDFFLPSKTGKAYTFKPGKITISEDLVIPANSALYANPGTTIDLVKHAKIISYSALVFNGREDATVIIGSSDSTSQGIEVISADRSLLNYVVFRNLPKVRDTDWKRGGAITFYESPVDFKNCSFYNSAAEDAVNVIRSDFSFSQCLFREMKDDALDIDFSEGTIANCVFENCSENALDITMGKVSVSSVYVNGAGNKALNIKAGTELKGKGVRIKAANIGISAEDQSTVDLQQVTITDSEMGLVAYKNKPGAGRPKMTITGLKLTNVKRNYLKENKSTMLANGVAVEDQADDVEAIIKSDKKKKHK